VKTIIGMVVTRDGHARQTYLHQPEPRRVGLSLAYELPPPETRRRHFTIAALEVRTVQRSWLGISLGHDHGRIIGSVAHLELAPDGSLWMVAEVHGATPEGPVYCSPESTARRDGTDVELDGIALTDNPAQILMEAGVLL
jgi:hypothetical protein